MPLIKDNAFVENTFAHVADDETPPEGAIVVSLKRWQAERETLAARNAPLGIRLASDQSPETLGADVTHFALIELEFPKFRDGRGYSYARILRQRLGFTGEIRAVGDVLRDQWLFMSRCGVDAFEVRPGTRLEDFRAALAEQTVFYQPASDCIRNVLDLRHTRTCAAAE
ncbi:MAG: DUF934 domain-containing protein [Alphaproteobacteria bacterium]|jgi:uncharacterized protein (DUF934 family)|nr:DUF934 domain-containing protein [Alphaproteobacteria bacterium]